MRRELAQEKVMSALSKIGIDLCTWYGETMARLDKIDKLEKCELLLCARDLEVETPAVRRALAGLLHEGRQSKPGDIPVVHAILFGLVFTRFGVGEELRQSFLEYWFTKGRFRKQGTFIAGALVNLALQNQHFLDPQVLSMAREWYMQQGVFRSDKLASWAPYCLQLAGYPGKAQFMAKEALGRRERDGSWGNDLKRTLGCAYALALSKLASQEDLAKTIDYLISRYWQGIIADIPLRSQTFKLFHILGLLPEGHLHRLFKLLTRFRNVFLSYSRIDLEVAEKVVAHLEEQGFVVWIDRTGIAFGDEWPKKIAAGINASEVILMLITKSSIQSDYCSREIIYALKKRKPLVALHVDQVPLPDEIDLMLGDIQRISMSDYTDFPVLMRDVGEGLNRA
jgi:hypothetical protein